MRARRRVNLLLDAGTEDFLSSLISYCLVMLVLVSVAAVVLETVPELRAQCHREFAIVEGVALAAFTIEYVLRIWSAPDSAPYFGATPWRARLAYARSPYAIIDLATILPFYLIQFGVVLPGNIRVLLVTRLARLFKLARYSSGIRSLAAALKAERRALGASAIIALGVVLIMASAMHVAEHAAQPDKFGSIPQAMWWAVVTITTVGYGDVVPITVAGRMIASFAALMGLVLLALPVGVVASAFIEQIHRRDFVVTWSMIARVPLFSTLDAAEIADVMHYLRAQTVPAGAIIVRRGEITRSMYFIASGGVEVLLPHNPMHLGEGQFFGEFSIIRKSRNVATVRAIQPAKLLILDIDDLNALMARNPEISERLENAIEAYDDIDTQPPRSDKKTSSPKNAPPQA
ncbi:MAG: cyclic nucleotide-gated ion channel [Rhodoblastus sp.]